MPVQHNYLKYKDIHTIENLEGVPITYVINKVSCDNITEVRRCNILPGETITLNFKLDGVYRITLINTITLEEETLEDILYYFNLITSFISSVENIFCGCTPCKECEECNECEDYLEALLKALAYTSLHEPQYQPYIDAINRESKCLLNDLVLCTLIQEKVNGMANYKEVLLYFLSSYYGAFYFNERFAAIDDEERAYVTTKYKYEKIVKCMKKAGFVPQDVVDIVESQSQVFFWQLDTPQETFEDVIPTITLPFLQTKPVDEFAEFEQGKIITYTSIGRICFAITPTQVQDFLIQDSLNNDITDAFDINYDPTLNLALFVSKIVYSHSSIYFKFKKLL
jgi:hypothetical protein